MGKSNMKASVQPGYAMRGGRMTRIDITILLGEGNEQEARDFLETTKKKKSLEINGLPPIKGYYLAVDY